MFAGAVRESVLSRPEVIRKINNDFIPVCIRATDLNNPPDNTEGKLMDAIRPACLAPQGMFVLNSQGKVVSHVITFNNTQAISDYLDFSLKSYKSQPAGSRDTIAQRFAKYPTVQAPATASPNDTGSCTSGGCGVAPAAPAGALRIEMVGRTLDPDGKLSSDTIHQEHYSQDQFFAPPELATRLVAVSQSGDASVEHKLPDEFGRILLTHAYLGNLDVQPFLTARSAKTDVPSCEFYARSVPGKSGIYQIRGVSHVSTGNDGFNPDGATWKNEVALTWNGFMEIQSKRITSLRLVARGQEQLEWLTDKPRVHTADEEVSGLPGGRPLTMTSRVILGFTGSTK